MESARKPPVRFSSKKAIKDFIDKICESKHLDDRDHLARVLGISSSALYGYIFRLEIPFKVHQKMLSLSETIASAGDASSDLSKVSLEGLLAEIEKRGWKVDLSRILKSE